MKIKDIEYAKLIVAASERGIDPKKLAPELWQSLYANKALNKLNLIFKQAEKIMAEKQNQLLVQVTSAVALDHSEKTALEFELKRRHNKEIVAEYEIDSDLGSGIKVMAGDHTLDYSSQSQIEQLDKYLKSI